MAHLHSHLSKHFVASIFYAHGLLLLWIVLSLHSPTAVAGSVGINYGMVANNLPSPQQALQLIQSISITKVKLFDTDDQVLAALAKTQMEVIVCFPNQQIESVAQQPSLARQWIWENVAQHINASTNITAIAVGNEVLTTNSQLGDLLLPAMQNLHAALVSLKLDSRVKLSTPHSMAVLSCSYPPSAGAFQPNFATTVIKPLLHFLSQTGSYMMINAYPYFAYMHNPTLISLDFTLFRPNAGVRDPHTGLLYTNMLDAQVDAVYAAMGALGHNDVRIVVTETGWASKGDPNEAGSSIANAAAYNANLMAHIKSGKGTPMKPTRTLDAFIFALFNEDLKPGAESERNYGLFYPNRSKVYDISSPRMHHNMM